VIELLFVDMNYRHTIRLIRNTVVEEQLRKTFLEYADLKKSIIDDTEYEDREFDKTPSCRANWKRMANAMRVTKSRYVLKGPNEGTRDEAVYARVCFNGQHTEHFRIEGVDLYGYYKEPHRAMTPFVEDWQRVSDACGFVGDVPMNPSENTRIWWSSEIGYELSNLFDHESI